jgi:hypothetical protein
VTVKTQNGGSFLVVSVSDNSPGVPADVTAQLFKPFTTGGRAGAGLGLCIARDWCAPWRRDRSPKPARRHHVPLHPAAERPLTLIFLSLWRFAEGKETPERRRIRLGLQFSVNARMHGR